MSTEEKDALVRAIESDLERLSIVDNELKRVQARHDAAVARVTREYAPRVDGLTQERQQLVDKVVELWMENRDKLLDGKSKTVTFRSGSLSVRMSAGKLIIDDEDRVMRSLRRKGKLKLFTRVGKRTLDKTALKKSPDFLKTLPGVRTDTPEMLTIKLHRSETEIIKELHPYRRTV